MFLLLGLINIIEKNKNWQIKTILFYWFSLFSQELAVFFSFIFIIFIFLKNKKHFLKFKKTIVLLLSITIFFIFFRFYFVNKSLFQNVHYYVSFSPKKILNNLLWYIFWSFSVPEFIINFIGNNFKPLSPLFTVFKRQAILSLFVLSVNLLIFAYFFIKSKDKKRIFLYFLCFLFSLFPVLIFPWHKYVYHLPCAMVFIYLSIAVSIRYFKSSSLVFVLLIFMLISVLTTNFIDRQTSFNYKRGKTAANIRKNLELKKISFGEKKFLIKNDPSFEVFSQDWGSTSSQAKIILNDQIGLQLMTGNNQLKTFYEDEIKKGFEQFDCQLIIKKEW